MSLVRDAVDVQADAVPAGRAAAWRRFQNCRTASCSASSNSVAIGPPSERPETAAFVNEAAVWLVRDERLLDVAGDDRIQSKGAGALVDGPDRPRSAPMHG